MSTYLYLLVLFVSIFILEPSGEKNYICTKVVADAQNECRSMRREHVNNTCCQHLGGGLTLKFLHTVHSALCSVIPGKQEIFILCP